MVLAALVFLGIFSGCGSTSPTSSALPTDALSVGAESKASEGSEANEATAPASAQAGDRATFSLGQIGHVFIIMLENEDEAVTFGAHSSAPYMAGDLRQAGELLPNYYGIAHHSLPNYLALISGQAPNPSTQADCPVFAPFRKTGDAAHEQPVGAGCVYPAGVRTLADQMNEAHLTWRAYMQDMGAPCGHPEIGGPDTTHKATPTRMYAARHNPFVYFRSILDSGRCLSDVVDAGELAGDLHYERTTPNLSFISPDLCHDAHDDPCADGSMGGLAAANNWLLEWVPRILASPAFQHDGLLVITFDESDHGAEACCGEATGPNVGMPGIKGPGGGRVGALLLSPFAKPGSENPTPYNHYSLLATIEDIFGLKRLGYAETATPLGSELFTR